MKIINSPAKKLFAVGTTLVLLLGATGVMQAHAAYLRQLDIGARGADVTELQTYLAATPAFYPQGLITGYFGSMTASAVARFQTNYGIAPVGRVGPVTIAKLNSLLGGDATTFGPMAPTIRNVSVSTSNSSATITFNTNGATNGRIYYATQSISMLEASATSRMTINAPYVQESQSGTSHQITLTNLNSNTTYYYVVYASDSNGNESIILPAVLSTQ